MNNSHIYKLNKLHHQIISHFALRDSQKYPDFSTEIMQRFGFESKFGLNLILNAIYLIEDTEYTKISFLKFGLQGPSRYEDIGERYLRLYGILNAIYQQFLALVNLLELYKINNKKKIIEELKTTRILELRNKIGAHSANYRNNLNMSEAKIEVYEISRNELRNGNVRILKNQNEFDKFDLQLDIEKFDILLKEYLYKIIEKIIKKTFNNQTKFKNELNQIREEIESIRGNKVIKINNITMIDDIT